ncbi:hypothetical protein AMECASPLE_038010 [Ameca splendens]|uniref:Uncharacterized protein n=1 Tax=Ameca splendens TaxID=208324 RepID=A0ABV0XL97_9TELE
MRELGMVKGCLQADGHRVQWDRIKESMHRVNAPRSFGKDDTAVIHSEKDLFCAAAFVISPCGHHPQADTVQHNYIWWSRWILKKDWETSPLGFIETASL